MEAKAKTSGHASEGHGMDVLAPNAHGEELREVGEEHEPKRDWKHELEGLLKQLNEMIHRASGKGHDRAGGSTSHPLVIAAVITGLITGGSSVLLHIFQDREARNQRANELYKSKLDFVGTFGDSFPRSLNALYMNMNEMVWLRCYPVSFYVDAGDDAAVKAWSDATSRNIAPPAAPEDAVKSRDEHRIAFSDSAKSRLQEKKITAMCAQALALFSHEQGEDIRKLLKTVRDIQNIADDPKPPEKWKRENYAAISARLSSLHDEANELFAKVLETLGMQLGENGPEK